MTHRTPIEPSITSSFGPDVSPKGGSLGGDTLKRMIQGLCRDIKQLTSLVRSNAKRIAALEKLVDGLDTNVQEAQVVTQRLQDNKREDTDDDPALQFDLTTSRIPKASTPSRLVDSMFWERNNIMTLEGRKAYADCILRVLNPDAGSTSDSDFRLTVNDGGTIKEWIIEYDKDQDQMSFNHDNGPGGVRRMILSNAGLLYLDSIPDAGSDTDKFLVSASGYIKHRTASELLSDLDISASRCVSIQMVDSDTSVATGDGTVAFCVPAELNNYDLTDVIASVHTKGVTGTTDIQVRRRRAGSNADMLTTKITIGDEFYASDEGVNTSNDDVQTGDEIYIDVDAVHSGTAPLGLTITLTFEPQ